MSVESSMRLPVVASNAWLPTARVFCTSFDIMKDNMTDLPEDVTATRRATCCLKLLHHDPEILTLQTNTKSQAIVAFDGVPTRSHLVGQQARRTTTQGVRGKVASPNAGGARRFAATHHTRCSSSVDSHFPDFFRRQLANRVSGTLGVLLSLRNRRHKRFARAPISFDKFGSDFQSRTFFAARAKFGCPRVSGWIILSA